MLCVHHGVKTTRCFTLGFWVVACSQVLIPVHLSFRVSQSTQLFKQLNVIIVPKPCVCFFFKFFFFPNGGPWFWTLCHKDKKSLHLGFFLMFHVQTTFLVFHWKRFHVEPLHSASYSAFHHSTQTHTLGPCYTNTQMLGCYCCKGIGTGFLAWKWRSWMIAAAEMQFKDSPVQMLKRGSAWHPPNSA